MGLTGVLANVPNWLHTAEALHPVAAAQSKAEKETKGWDRLPPTAQRAIMVTSATTKNSIPTLPPPTINRFLKARNATALQVNCFLTYTRGGIYLPTSFCQALLQWHILAIPDPDAPTVFSPLLTPPYSSGPANAHQRAMRIQFLLSMGQDRLFKEEAGKLLDQRVHVVTSTQEMRHLTRKFVKLVGEYVGEECPISLSMETWPLQIDLFEQQYNKALARDPLFWVD